MNNIDIINHYGPVKYQNIYRTNDYQYLSNYNGRLKIKSHKALKNIFKTEKVER